MSNKKKSNKKNAEITINTTEFNKCTHPGCTENAAMWTGEKEYACLKHLTPELREIYDDQLEALEEELADHNCGSNEKFVPPKCALPGCNEDAVMWVRDSNECVCFKHIPPEHKKWYEKELKKLKKLDTHDGKSNDKKDKGKNHK